MPAHIHQCGHICLSDGSVLRLDPDGLRWRARWYAAPHMSLIAWACGPYSQMESVVNAWCDAFDLSLTSVKGDGGRSGQVSPHTLPGPTTLGETA